MEKIIVTTGQPFTDIDALACAIAYTELLRLEGKDAEAVLPGPLNKSITNEIKSWNLKFLKTEMVGACATLIWEEYVKRKKSNEISEMSGNLLSTAIISNTLNFNAMVTTDRDKKSL